MPEAPKKSFADRFAAFEHEKSVPAAFSSTVKDTNKLGTRKFAPAKQYIRKDINIGSKIAGKDSDLEGLGDVFNKVKKEHVEIGSGAIRKFKMTKQLSGRFNQEARKEEAMEMHKQKQEEAKKKKEEDEAMANMSLAERRAYEARKRADEDAKKRSQKITVKPSYRNNTLLSPKSKFGRNKAGGREKLNILALVDDAIENDPSEEAKKKVAALKAAADAPILPAAKKVSKKKKKEKQKPNILAMVDDAIENSPPTPIMEAAASKKAAENAPILPPPIKPDSPEPVRTKSSDILSKVDVAIESSPPNPVKEAAAAKRTLAEAPVPPKVSAPKAVVKVTPAPKKEMKLEPKKEPKAEPKTPIKNSPPTPVKEAVSAKRTLEEAPIPPKVEAVSSLFSSAPKAVVKVTPAPKKEMKLEPKKEPKAEPKTPIKNSPPTPVKEAAAAKRTLEEAPIPPKVEVVSSPFSSAPKAVVEVTPAPKKETKLEPKEEPKSEPKTPIQNSPPIPVEEAAAAKKTLEDAQVPPKVEAVPSPFSSAPTAAVEVTPAPKKEMKLEPKEELKDEPKTPIQQMSSTKSPKPSVTPPLYGAKDDSHSPRVEVQSSSDVGKALSPNEHENTMLSPNGYRKAVKSFKLSTAKPRLSMDTEEEKETPYVYDSIYDDDTALELRTRLDEVELQLELCRRDGAIELEALKKQIASEKIQFSQEIGQQIQQHRVVNSKQAKSDQKAVDEEKKIVDTLREENKRLRATVEKYPHQMAEVMASSESLRTANEEVAGHFKKLNEFTKKLQADHDRLEESNSKCRDEYLPRYRQELYERNYYSVGETRIKVSYRNCLLKIAKHVEKSRQPKLWEDVNILVVETEADVNPKFDPRHLFANQSDSDDSSSSDSSDSDDSDSDSD
jgi:hypothetical protein